MTDQDAPLVFLDANVLAKPSTRTLVLRCARSGYDVTWSETAETQADRHGGPRKTPVERVRAQIGIALSGTGTDPARFAVTAAEDRQILADAEVAGARFLLTEDVDDFGGVDLELTGVTAVNPDLFLAERSAPDVYAAALREMAARMTDPPVTVAELHARVARQHPRLFAAHADLFDVEPSRTVHNEPRILFRGATCLRCLGTAVSGEVMPDGLCSACMPATEWSVGPNWSGWRP